MIAAGLLARNAVAKGLTVKPWVKTSLAPGSQVVEEYLEGRRIAEVARQARLQHRRLRLHHLHRQFRAAGAEAISATIAKHNLVAAAVLSGNRNFEGRVNPDVRANYLASPPLVVAYALAGSMQVDLTKDPLGHDKSGAPVYPRRHLADQRRRVADLDRQHDHRQNVQDANTPACSTATPTGARSRCPPASPMPGTWARPMCRTRPISRASRWSRSRSRTSSARASSANSSIRSPPTIFRRPARSARRARPANICIEHQVRPVDFNQYGTRRGNHEVMMRGTFANIRIKNQMVKDESGNVVEGGYTIHYPSGERMAIYDAAMRYQKEGVPLVVFAGREYGTGSSRDWAAKGTKLLGVRAVIAQSFERIHRSNLVGMGVLPLRVRGGNVLADARPEGRREGHHPRPDARPEARARQWRPRSSRPTARRQNVPLICRIDTLDELEYFRNGGILHYVLRQLAA